MESVNPNQIVPTNISDTYERHRGVYLKSICDKNGQLLECYELLKYCRDITTFNLIQRSFLEGFSL